VQYALEPVCQEFWTLLQKYFGDLQQMKRKALFVSGILNIIFFGILCFGAYYKRTSIIRYVDIFYNVVFNKNEKVENDISVFNQSPYETDIKHINEKWYDKRIKVAILGNSISLHGIVEGLWDHESGMAASDFEHDYVHVLLNKISIEKQCGIEYIIINIADFERSFEQFDNNRLETVKGFEPEIIIFQIGENVSTELLRTEGDLFVSNYVGMIAYCAGKEAIVCLPFWPVKEKLNLITEVALRSGSYLVDLSHLGSGIDSLNLAKSENKYKHAGVAIHPGDYGMNRIAEILYITINKIME
jgi:hypothetical protein